jgi:DNA polymerase I-like protein with 3'-5' exonuclease and polymerase domains
MPYHRTQDEGNSALPERQYRLLTTKAQIDKCVAAIAQSGEVHALDFETTGLRPESAEVRLTCICGPAGGFVIDHFVSGVPFGAIAGKLAKACAWAVFNAGFEGRWFDYETDGPDVVLYDVGVMSKAKLGGRPLRLAEQVKRDLGKERDNKDLQVSDWSADELTQEQYDYGFEDADDTYALWTLWKAALSAAQWNGFLVLNDAWRGTAEMEDTGMLIDAPYHETLIAMWTRRRAAAEIVLRRYTPESVIENLRSKKMLSDFLKTVLDETSVRAWPSTAKNSQLQTTRAQLRQASFRAPYPFSRWLAALMVFNRADKYLSTYGENLLTKQSLSPDGRVHGRFNIAQAITARYSSSSPNLQNIPRSPVVRRSFIAPDGTDMVLADYSGVELRVLAEVSDDPQLKQDVIFGDVHAESAITLFRQNRDEFLARLKAKDPAAKEMRSKAKAFSFQLCIAEGQLVLTDHGLVPIEQVDRSMQVWDGVEWVSHDGVIYKGIQEVIDHDGLTATPGHKVFCTDGTIRPFHHVALSQHGLRVTRTAVAHIPIRDVRVYTQHPDAHAQRAHDDVGVSTMRQGAAEMAAQHAGGARQRLPVSTQPEASLRLRSVADFDEALHGSEGAVQTARGELEVLRPARNRDALQRQSGIHRRDSARVSASDCGGAGLPASGPYRQQRTLRAGQHTLGNAAGKPAKQARVYDILNAGPRRRFTVSGQLVSNCYGAGSAALALVLRCSDDEAKEYVEAWAARYPRAYALRYKMFDEMMASGLLPIKSGRTVYVHRNDRTLPVAANYPIQGAAADVMYRAVTRMNEVMWEVPYPARMLASVHDELLLLCREGHGEDLEQRLQEQMRLAWLDIFPNTATDNLIDSAVGKSWAAKP